MKPRKTFNFQIEYDSQYGLGPWKWVSIYNGFNINVGLLGFAVRIQYVKENYR